jgi:NTE family protein
LYKRTNLRSFWTFILSLFFILFTECFAQQKVGLVLSGGGAAGVAHVGVLKALEERHIPIDFIVGTSAGALVASMYASGYSPSEIEAYVLSEPFQLMVKGELEVDKKFYFFDDSNTSSMFNIPFSKDSILQKSIPMSFVDPSYFDFEMLRILGRTSASVGNDFNQLFVPFRCVASDVVRKESVVFSDGNLNESVRASMTFPLYLNPIRIKGVLYFDGGLYDNFPLNAMYEQFDADFIIGSNVTKNDIKANENDFFGMISSMMTTPTNYSLPCQEGIIIEPKTEVGTFEFEHVKQAIEDGYRATLLKLDSLEQFIDVRENSDSLANRRKAFRLKVNPILVSSVKTASNKKNEFQYANKFILPKGSRRILDEEELKERYFRLASTPQINFIYPNFESKPDGTLQLNLNVKKAKEFRADFGGLISSRAVNTGYFNLSYRSIGRVAHKINAESYFGKFYGSLRTNYELVLPSVFPISVSGYFTLNRWDYFRSFATFFEEVRPSFLVQNEAYGGVKVKLPLGNNARWVLDARYFSLEDDYYQSSEFTSKDTADFTRFFGTSLSAEYTKNSLNRKQFASEGHFFQVKARYVNGFERTVPGTTSILKDTVEKDHQWLSVQAEFQSYFIKKGPFHIGLHGKTVVNSQSLFANYTASLLSMPTFNLIPDMETFFLPEYRATQYMSLGTNVVLELFHKLDFRMDVYYFQPFMQLRQNIDGTIQYVKPQQVKSLVASSSILYHTPIGPVRATVNYFPAQEHPLFFQLSFGYILFNERAIR